MDQRTSDRDAGLTTEFERDVVRLLLEAVRAVGRQERADVGTEGLLYALVSGDWAAGSAIAPGTRASGTLGGSIGSRGTSVWVSEDKGDGTEGSPDDEREIDAVWREVRHEEAERLRWKNRKEETPQGVELPPMTGALRSCLRGALEAAREEGTVSVRVRHVARTLVELPDTRAREALVLEKLDIAAAAAALDALRARDEAPEPGPVLLMRKAGTFGKSGNPLTRKVMAWVSGGGAGFGSAVVGAVRAEARRGAVRRGAPRTEPVDLLLGILALDRSLAVAGRELPGELAGANRGAELLRRHGARQGALARVLLPSSGVAQETPPEDTGPADFEQRLLHVTQLTASAQGSPTVGTTHLLAALLDGKGTDAASAVEVARVLTESGVDVDGLRAEPELRVPGGAAEGV
ncbi:Clp R domain-containing protein OS=Streptomyces rochei OX=1928 GN=G3I25_10910 PE=4 SV=1 [Streptomyces rochei]|uniref:Clp protease N-terminal domain-containing protein n=1 Tax=Streptomyces sp. NRRL WC-3795 TaxID=1463938 RepID=UPI0004C638B6|nr:Clp protease N-terminal domain-containing protein [Streptomyces sp. NRRL WC-3795]